MVPSHLLAGPSSGSSIRRASLSPPGSAHLPRRGSSLRQTSSACDLIEAGEDVHDEEDDNAHHLSASSPTASESSEDDACDFQDHFPAPPSSSSSSSSLSSLKEERKSRSTTIMGGLAPPSPKDKACPSITSTHTASASVRPATASSSINTHKRPRGLAPLSSISATTGNSNADSNLCASGGALSLPKAQPLARALFARMTDSPHAGTGLGLMGGSGNKKGGKTKMIVATKPMRTTFELGLTSSELARRA